MTGPRTDWGRHARRISAAVLFLAGAASGLVADDVEPVFQAVARDGRAELGQLARFDLKAGATLVEGSKPERSIPIDKLDRLIREDAPTAPPIEDGVVLFPEGDRIVRAKIANADDTTVMVQTGCLGVLPIPLDHALALVTTPPRDANARAALLRSLRDSKANSEVLWLANGDKIHGGLLAFTEKSAKMQAATGPVEIDRAGVVALGFDPSLVAYPKPEGEYVEAVFVDGSRIGVREARVDGGFLLGYARFGPPIKAAIADVVELRIRSDAVRFLSDDLPLQDRYRYFVGPTLPYRRDANALGRPIRLGGRTYEHGLGTQPRTLLAYRVGAGWKRFQATVGLDEQAGPLGHAVFRVLVDGKEAAASPPLTVRDKPHVFDVPVEGAKLLILVTEFGERGNVQDVADWADARFTK